MTKKQEFINFINDVMKEFNIGPDNMSENVRLYWEAFCGQDDVEKPLFTDNGKVILQYMQNNLETPMWKARDLAEGLFINSRAVSGAMRKLVTDGFVEKGGQDPVVYAITEAGKTIEIV
jgi:hypothetical protein